MPEENLPDDSSIFERLVNQSNSKEERIFGMLAYAKYQIEKNRWLSKIPNPTSEQSAAFYAHYDDHRLDELVQNVQIIVLAYADEYAKEQLNKELDRYKKEVLSVELKKIKVGFWLPVWQGFLASAAFAIALFVAGVFVSLANPNSNMTRLLQFLFSPDQYELKRIGPKSQSIPTPSQVTPEKNKLTK